MSTVRTIAKNTIILIAAQGIGYIFSFIYIIYLARYLGPEKYGILSFAISFTGFFQIFMDIGLSTLLVREITKDKSRAVKYLVNAGFVKVILAIFSLILIYAVINVMGYPTDTIFIVFLIGISVVLNSISQLLFSFFQAFENMELQGLGQIIFMLFMFIAIMLGITFNFDIVGFGYIYLISGILLLVYNVIVLKIKYFGRKNALVTNNMTIEWKFCKSMVIEAWSFGLATVFVLVYTNMDAIILSAAKGNEAVGIYGAAYRIIQVLQVIPMMLGASIFPVMSRFYKTADHSLKLTMEKSFKYLTVIALPTGVGITILANQIISRLYGAEYTQSIIAIQILIWADVLLFIGYSVGILMMSINRQKLNTLTLAVCAIINVGLNLIFIPRYSYIAAAAILVGTQAIYIIMLYVLNLGNDYILSLRKVVPILIRTIVASLVMGMCVIYFQNISLFILIPAAIILYFVILLLIGGLNKDDFILIRDGILKKQ